MIRIEAKMQDGKKVWIETNDVEVAKNFIDLVDRFEYKEVVNVCDESSSASANYIHARVPKIHKNYEMSGR